MIRDKNPLPARYEPPHIEPLGALRALIRGTGTPLRADVCDAEVDCTENGEDVFNNDAQCSGVVRPGTC